MSAPAPAAAPAATPAETVLRVEGLVTRFRTERGSVAAVDGVSFDVAAGETLAIVGESGSGKSVTALSILRLIPDPPGRIEAGRILFEGRDLLSLSEREIRAVRGNRIGMVFQEPMTSLNPVLTIGRQIGEPIELHQGARREDALTRAIQLMRQVHIPAPADRIHAYPHQFSGGMRQRVMIAMALACQPRLIIADEPTTALDVTVQAQILELLKQATREVGSALMLITHDLGVVARYADRVNVMYAGRIVESGPARAIYKTPRHPYTIGLMSAAPRLDHGRRTRLETIEGQPPNLARLPPGCPFAPRCAFAIDVCRKDRPPLRPVGDRHDAACWVDVGRA